ncbi:MULTISPECIES: signal peptidase I [Microbacterium]|jgi:signal peptidase|uniref:signal peptidase I n=1 Tax=Microbacterium TaxID=33882 RepID=UPI0023D9C671|nr:MULTISPECIES: signal peptidase I [Microbacterium]MDF2047885.1 signal peptidase I [Microbacterium sp. Kw_RZR3]MDQ1074608.1 signal peptidase I [Microbacterium sp. SORGH_AS_0969]MDQ1114836.1 signal peptidase I [Microbacterium testaceum]
MNRTLRAALSPVRWIIVAVLLAALGGPFAYGAVTQQEIVRVDGDSMVPTFHLGDVLFVGRAEPDELVPGAIVTVEPPGSGRYTHRIVAVEGDSLTLRGDANAEADPIPVAVSDVRGVVRHHLEGPPATVLLAVDTLPMRLSLVVLLIGLIFLPLPVRRGRGPVAPVDLDHDAQPTTRREVRAKTLP